MKKILITGGTGFIGSNLAFKFANDFDVVVLGRNIGLGRSIQDRISVNFKSVDITDYEAMRRVFKEITPEYVIHAAASKYVDYAEGDPLECFKTNIRGSAVLAEVAVESGVQSVIGISTDKAATAHWTAYGASKLSMEILFERMDQRSSTRFTSLRFGNVAWSTGSVLPLWQTMRIQDSLIKTTGYEMSRFMCSVDEVYDYVRYALQNIDSFGGSTMVPLFKWLYIKDLLSGFLLENPCDFQCIKPRIGEKQEEVLMSGVERSFAETYAAYGLPLYKIRHGMQNTSPRNNLPDLGTSEACQHDQASLQVLIKSRGSVF